MMSPEAMTTSQLATLSHAHPRLLLKNEIPQPKVSPPIPIAAVRPPMAVSSSCARTAVYVGPRIAGSDGDGAPVRVNCDIVQVSKVNRDPVGDVRYIGERSVAA